MTHTLPKLETTGYGIYGTYRPHGSSRYDNERTECLAQFDADQYDQAEAALLDMTTNPSQYADVSHTAAGFGALKTMRPISYYDSLRIVRYVHDRALDNVSIGEW